MSVRSQWQRFGGPGQPGTELMYRHLHREIYSLSTDDQIIDQVMSVRSRTGSRSSVLHHEFEGTPAFGFFQRLLVTGYYAWGVASGMHQESHRMSLDQAHHPTPSKTGPRV